MRVIITMNCIHFFMLLLLCATPILSIPVPHGSVKTVKLDPKRIICPVLAAMYNAGDLHPDETGSCTFEDIYSGLRDKLYCNQALSYEQASGIANYNYTNKVDELHRDRCLPGTKCFTQRMKDGHSTQETERWLNIFNMNGKQAVEHGFSTGVRGGAGNVPEFDFVGGPCNGEYPCEDRFQKFYVPCAEKDTGRFYRDNILCVICNAQKYGDRTGEFSFNRLQSARQWQIVAAMTGWLQAFGRFDPTQPFANRTNWFEMEDVRAMIMEGRYPDGWVKRPWGAPDDLAKASQITLPCVDEKGNQPQWWEGSSCPAFTGQSCSPIKPCLGGATCLSSGQCVCGLDEDGISMCATQVDKSFICKKRTNKCTYFGEPCKIIKADNPAAPF